MRIKKQYKKSSGWKNNWNSWLKRPKNRWNRSIKNKSKSESFMRHTLSKKLKWKKLKPNWKKRKRKEVLSSKRLINTRLHNLKTRSRNCKHKGPKLRKKGMKRSEPLKDKESNWKLSWKGKSSFLKKRKSKYGWTNSSINKSSGWLIPTSKRPLMFKTKQKLQKITRRIKSVLSIKREERPQS